MKPKEGEINYEKYRKSPKKLTSKINRQEVEKITITGSPVKISCEQESRAAAFVSHQSHSV